MRDFADFGINIVSNKIVTSALMSIDCYFKQKCRTANAS